MPSVSYTELSAHAHESSAWLLIHGNVYDLTSFLDDHPGGKSILLSHAGRDATEGFAEIHSKDVLNLLEASCTVGPIDTTSAAVAATAVADIAETAPAVTTAASNTVTTVAAVAEASQSPPMSQMLNVFDFEAVAKSNMTPQGWA